MRHQPHALETTRQFASQAIERTGERVRDLRDGLKHASVDAQRQVDRYTRQTRRYVSERPVTSALIAAAVGAAIAGITLAVLRNRRGQS
jgi:ElaB/YqjD/DUF883 family membrane-anchored ribosome-binding protein